MSRQYWVAPMPPFHTADGTAYSTSTTLTDVGPTPQIVIPANMLEPGLRLGFEASGRFSNTGTPTLNLGVYSGTIGQAIGSGVALLTSGVVTTITAAANRTWRIEGRLICRTVGTSGTLFGVGELGNVTTAGRDLMPPTAPTTATVDTTVARYLTIGATWGTSSASNTLTVHAVDFWAYN